MGVSQSGNKTVNPYNTGDRPSLSGGSTKGTRDGSPAKDTIGYDTSGKEESAKDKEEQTKDKDEQAMSKGGRANSKVVQSKDKHFKAGRTEDASIVCKQDCKKKCPHKVEIAGSSGYVTKNAETADEAKRRKLNEEVASYSLMDALKQKDRHKLLNSDSVLALNGSSFINAMLKIHNFYRANHGVPPLKLNKQLSKIAQRRAMALVTTCSRSSKDIMGGAPQIPPTVGENVFHAISDNRTVAGAALACSDWYSVAGIFDYNNNFHKQIGKKKLAFMNMIWKKTSEMGAGRAASGGGNVVVVALYFPKSEIPNGIKDNVFPSALNVNTTSKRSQSRTSGTLSNKRSRAK